MSKPFSLLRLILLFCRKFKENYYELMPFYSFDFFPFLGFWDNFLFPIINLLKTIYKVFRVQVLTCTFKLENKDKYKIILKNNHYLPVKIIEKRKFKGIVD